MEYTKGFRLISTDSKLPENRFAATISVAAKMITHYPVFGEAGDETYSEFVLDLNEDAEKSNKVREFITFCGAGESLTLPGWKLDCQVVDIPYLN